VVLVQPTNLKGLRNMSAIEDRVCQKIQERAAFGFQKYGTTLLRTDLTTLDWLVHAQEEAMDMANYLQVLIEGEQRRLEKATNEKSKTFLPDSTAKRIEQADLNP